MKRSVKSLILLVVLVALVGSYGLVNKMNQQAEYAEEAGTFAMTEHAADELTGMIWTNDTQYHFTKDDDGWANADDADFHVNQDVVSELADKLTTMEATRKLSDVEQLEDYGFAEDSFTVTAEWSDGESTVYVLGDETPFADGYYVRIDGEENTVYTMTASLSAMFAETAVDLAELEEIGNVETATAISIGGSLNLVRHEESISIDPDQHWYNADGEPMDDEAVETLVSDIEALEWSALVAVSASDEELAEYQLDDANASMISVTGDDEDEIGLYIGTTDADGAYYARLPGSGMVYTMDAEAVEAVLANTEDDLWSNEIFSMEYANVQSLSCTLNGEEVIFEPAAEEEAESDEKSESEESDPAEDMWSQISSLYAKSSIVEEPSGEILLEISVTNMDDASLNCSIYSYDVDSYQITTSEGRNLLVSADDVDKLIRALKQ